MDWFSFNDSLASMTLKASMMAFATLIVSMILNRQNASVKSQIWSATAIALFIFPFISFCLPKWELNFLAPSTIAVGKNNLWNSNDWIFYLWGMGVLFFTIRLCLNLYKLKKIERSCVPVNNLKWIQISNQVSRSLNLKRKVRLLKSDHITMPVTWGFLNPCVVVPTESWKWNVRRKKMVLLHEFEHVYRKDWLIQIFSNLATALHWFNPLAWFVAIMIKLEREKACDDAVLRLGTSPTDYASTLLFFAQSKKEQAGLGLACALQLITGSQLQKRIQSILQTRKGRTRISKLGWLTLFLFTLVCLLPIASATTTPMAIQPNAPTRYHSTEVPELISKKNASEKKCHKNGLELNSKQSCAKKAKLVLPSET